MARHKGPYTAHLRYEPTPQVPAGRHVTCVRKTFAGAQNFLYMHDRHVIAKWITNAEGIVWSHLSKGDPS